MDLSDFVYELPGALVAPFPSRERAGSRLLVVKRRSGEIIHSAFAELGTFLNAGDLLVLNDTKVFPARLRGAKESGGRAAVLLLERFPEHGRSLWLALVDAGKKPRVGSRLLFDGGVTAEIIGSLERGRFGLEFHHEEDFDAVLARLGEPPLPPYVTRRRPPEALDRERYQTVYAAHAGAIAAPTAGFHFTAELFAKLEERGVERVALTLHVGPGTFQPVRDEQIENHHMEGERYYLGAAAAEKINRAKESGRRVIAVGSTSTRALEWITRQKGRVEADEGIARLFLRPGDSFRVIDGLVTNFHLPGSTPLILVAAFAGLDLVRRAYEEAVKQRYRFYSYGDAMLIL
jgi:S-adenosylmethionine:tRNA ribosyltransferase-isomerase